PNLDRDAALALAERAVRTELEADPGKLRLVGAEQMQQPARRDWSFEFADPAVKIGEGGEARLQVVIAGDQVANAGRYVFIPESWMRTQRERQSQFTFLKLALAALAGVLLVAGLVFAATQWMRRRFDRRALFAVAAISFTLAALALANNYPQAAMSFRTSEPIAAQAGLGIVGGLIAAVFGALVIGLVSAIGAWAATRLPRHDFAGRWPPWLAGACAALMVAGFEASLSALAPRMAPIWPTYALAGQAVPLLGAVLSGASALSVIGVGLFVLAALDRVTQGWQKHLWLAGGVLVLSLTATALVGSARPVAALISGAITGAAAVVIVYGVLRFDLRSVPAYIVTGMLLALAESAAHNGSARDIVHGALAAATAIGIAVLVTRYIDRGASEALAAHDAAGAIR
ncbi:MAG: hypothetical protein M3Z31_17055, partial [Pseudomonadota bacterium]|nr:hypothetical protein [Pseudomonadota bacterium]